MAIMSVYYMVITQDISSYERRNIVQNRLTPRTQCAKDSPDNHAKSLAQVELWGQNLQSEVLAFLRRIFGMPSTVMTTLVTRR